MRRARRTEILQVTLNPPPARLGITHWSTRLLARELDVSRDTIARVWREYGVQPWRAETFKFSTDPQLAATSPPARWTPSWWATCWRRYGSWPRTA